MKQRRILMVCCESYKFNNEEVEIQSLWSSFIIIVVNDNDFLLWAFLLFKSIIMIAITTLLSNHYQSVKLIKFVEGTGIIVYYGRI